MRFEAWLGSSFHRNSRSVNNDHSSRFCLMGSMDSISLRLYFSLLARVVTLVHSSLPVRRWLDSVDFRCQLTKSSIASTDMEVHGTCIRYISGLLEKRSNGSIDGLICSFVQGAPISLSTIPSRGQPLLILTMCGILSTIVLTSGIEGVGGVPFPATRPIRARF